MHSKKRLHWLKGWLGGARNRCRVSKQPLEFLLTLDFGSLHFVFPPCGPPFPYGPVVQAAMHGFSKLRWLRWFLLACTAHPPFLPSNHSGRRCTPGSTPQTSASAWEVVLSLRARDRDGSLINSLLSEKRDMGAAKRFFTPAVAVVGHAPERVTTRPMGMLPTPVRSARPWW